MSELAQENCIPCRGGVPPLKGEELDALQEKLGNGWQIINEHHLEKEYIFADFRQALDFTVKVGEVAENQDHHPDIASQYGIRSIPNLLVFSDGKVQQQIVGAVGKGELTEAINKLL